MGWCEEMIKWRVRDRQRRGRTVLLSFISFKYFASLCTFRELLTRSLRVRGRHHFCRNGLTLTHLCIYCLVVVRLDFV